MIDDTFEFNLSDREGAMLVQHMPRDLEALDSYPAGFFLLLLFLLSFIKKIFELDVPILTQSMVSYQIRLDFSCTKRFEPMSSLDTVPNRNANF